MLRMGRSPRAEQPNEAERPTPAQQPQQQQAAVPPRPAAPQPAPTAAGAQSAAHGQMPRPETAAPSTPRAVSETEVLARELREGVMSGFLGGNTVLTGDAEFKGMLRIDGRFSGRISSEKGTLIVSAGGRVDANIAVGVARINGTVNGDVTATERIEMGRSARVVGDIRTPVLVVEQGAVFEGGCRMTQTQAHAAEPTQAVGTQQSAGKTAAARPAAAPKPRPAVPPPPPVAPQTGGQHAGAENLAASSVN